MPDRSYEVGRNFLGEAPFPRGQKQASSSSGGKAKRPKVRHHPPQEKPRNEVGVFLFFSWSFWGFGKPCRGALGPGFPWAGAAAIHVLEDSGPFNMGSTSFLSGSRSAVGPPSSSLGPRPASARSLPDLLFPSEEEVDGCDLQTHFFSSFVNPRCGPNTFKPFVSFEIL